MAGTDWTKSFVTILKYKDMEKYHQYERVVQIVKKSIDYRQDNFDTHAGKEHISTVLKNADFLVPSEIKNRWSVDEVFLFLCSIWLHDIGKIRDFDSNLSYKEILSQHAERSYNFVLKINEKLSLDEKESLIIAYVVKGHTLLDLSELPEKKGLGIGKAIHIRPLSALLRLADELDMSYKRVPLIVKELSGISKNLKWEVRDSIDGIEINSNMWDIVVYSTPNSFETLEAVNNAVEWTNKIIESIRSELRKADILYRKIDLNIDDTLLKGIEKKSRKEGDVRSISIFGYEI